MIITDPWFYLTAIPAVIIFGIGKGGLGGALGVIAVPLMTLTTEPTQAAAILLPIMCLMDLLAIRQHRRNVSTEILKRMLPGAIVGIALAGLFLGTVPEVGLRLFIGILSLLFVAQYLLGQGKGGKAKGAWFWSCLSGFSSTAIHAGGAPASIYLLPLRLDKLVLIGTMAVLFGIINFVKLVPYTLLGGFDSTNLMTSLVLTPLAPVGVYLGVKLLHNVSQQTVYRLCYFFLFISGIKLTWDALPL